MTQQTYYQTLGVDTTATADDIKRAYRTLARKHHPDVSDEKDAEAKMKAINEAYETLNDPQKRADYDRFGHATSQTHQQQPYTQGQYQQYGQQFTTFEDLLAAMFSQQRQQQYQRTQQRPQPAQDNIFVKFIRFAYLMMVIRFIMSILF